MPRGEPKTLMSAFQLTWGLEGWWAQPLSCKPKFSLAQKCLGINVLLRQNSFIKSGRGKKKAYLQCFLIILHCCNPFLLWTETRNWKDSFLGGSRFLCFCTVLACVHLLCSSSLPHPALFSCQYFVSSGCSKLWFRKIVLLFTPRPGFPDLPQLAFYVVSN